MKFYHEQNILTITLEKKIDYKASSLYNDIVNDWMLTSFNVIELDFLETEFVTLAGAMYLIFPIFHIVSTKKKAGIYVETGITGYSKRLINTLANFGFISILKLYGNLKITTDLDQLSNSRIMFWEKSIKKTGIDLKSVYWPISSIPMKFANSFEFEIYKFFNNFIDCFKTVIDLEMIKNLNNETSDEIERFFTKSVNESTKNVWDHSDSWGIASIQSNKINKTTFCLFDFGIGFINSYIKRKGNYMRNVQRDKEVLEWLFQEGNTSNSEGNHGHGLSIIRKFVDITEGVMLISTDNYLLSYNKKEGLDINIKRYYPGTQIMINF